MIKPGTREAHIVGGHHPDWPFEYFERMIAAIHAARPETQIKAFTAAEIDYFWRRWKIEPREALTRLKKAGLHSMPGGGAEIFSTRLAASCSSYTGKADADRWCEIHGIAHSLGIKTNATMLYGHVETMAERVDHLLRLREQQDQSRAASSPSFRSRTRSGPPSWCRARRRPPTTSAPSPPRASLLDNFPHIEAYWVMIGEETASLALHFGASDVNGTLEDEKIAHMAQAAEPARPRPGADPPHDPRRRQDPGRARRALQRRQGLELGVLDRDPRQGRKRASGSTAPRGAGSSPRRRSSTWAASPRRRASARIPEQAGHLRHRLEPELHERVHHRLPVLRLLPEARRQGGLHAHRRRGPGQKVESAAAPRRDHRAPPGRPQPRASPRLLPVARARDAAALPAGDAALLHRVRDPDDGAGLGARRCPRCSPRSRTRARRRCPAAAPRSCPSGCASASSPRRAGPAAWLDVHREAHRQGFKSTATMMYGHVETPDDILDHLDAIRELQDEHGGFTAFVPWSFKPGNTLLEKWIKHYKGPNAYLRMLAVSRLYLDNFPHVQASWFSEGKRAGQVALSLGRGRLRRHALRGERPRRRRLRQQDHGGRDRHADPRRGLHARPARHGVRDPHATY